MAEVHLPPVLVDVVPVGIRADLPVGAAVQVHHRRELEDHLVAQRAGRGVIGHDETQSALHDVRRPGLPGMLAGLEPDRLLAGVGHVRVGDRHHRDVAALHRLADRLDNGAGKLPQVGQEPCQIVRRVWRNVRDPDRVPLRPKPERRLLLLGVPFNRRKVLPMMPVIAEDRHDVRPHRAGARLVVVLADEIRKRQRHVLAADVIHAEVIPGRLPVPAALVLLAQDVAAERGFAEPLDPAQRCAFEVQVEGDSFGRGAGGDRAQEGDDGGDTPDR